MIRRPPRSTRTDTLFPTRRSSDLVLRSAQPVASNVPKKFLDGPPPAVRLCGRISITRIVKQFSCQLSNSRKRRRSEEHTSELQSLMRNSYAVFCLKKKKKKHKHKNKLNTLDLHN